MAQPVLQIVGTAVGFAFGGPIGAAIGGAIGGYVGGLIDGPQQFEGPRLTDLKVSSSAYGQTIPLIFGRQNRVSGNMIWSSGLKEKSKKKKSGGKGGGGSETTTYTYSSSVAIAICDGTTSSFRKMVIGKIWANGKLLIDLQDLFFDVIDGAENDVIELQAKLDELNAKLIDPAYEDERRSIMIRIAITEQELADAQQNLSDAQDSSDQYLGIDGYGWSIDLGRISGNYNVGKIAFYPGSSYQLPDPTIEADKGAGNTPAYRGTVYAVLTDLQLADYGNSIPNLEFEVIYLDGNSARSIIAEISNKAGLEPTQYSIDTKLDDIVNGYVLARQSTAIAAIQPLMNAYAFDAVENGGQIRFTKRGKSPIAAIEAHEMAARQRTDGGADDTATFVRAPESSMPKVATVTYKDLERDYQDNTQLAEREGGDARNNINEQLAITLDNNTARKIVDRLLWESWVGRLSARFKVSDKWSFLKPSDVVTIKLAGVMSPFRIVNFTRGFDGIIEANAILEDPFIYDGATSGTSATIPEQEVQFVGDTIVYCFNAPLIYPNESDSSFNYSVDATETGWRGGFVYRSLDDVSYSEIYNTGTRNTTGFVTDALPNASSDYWDRVNKLTVTLNYQEHELESLPEEDVLNGKNAFWLGAKDGSVGEVIQFANATLVSASPKVYELSDLLRGRIGTEHYTDSHSSDDIFVLFESGLMATTDFGVTDWDKRRFYKGVSIYQSDGDIFNSQEFTNTGEKARPLSPVHAIANRDSSNNMTITWVRRSRGLVPEIGYGEVPLNETTELYEIDVYNGMNVVRTITATSPQASYSEAEQIADGLTPGDNVEIKIYQISETRGRGHEGVFTV